MQFFRMLGFLVHMWMKIGNRGSNSITKIYSKSKESSLSEGYDSKSCTQINHRKNLVLGPLKITAATTPISHRKYTERIFAYVLLWERGQVAAPIYRGYRAKIFWWTICNHDFGPYPSDRELFYDIACIVVRLGSKGLSSLRFGSSVDEVL